MTIEKLSAELSRRDERIAALEKKIAEEEQQRKTQQLTALGVSEQRAKKLSASDDEIFTEMVAEIQLARKQHNLTHTRYDTGENGKKRENPLLIGVKK